MDPKLNNLFAKTKAHTQAYRACFALNRNSAGFTRELKESTFTLVCDRAEGPYVYDLDGNRMIDLTMGFGSVFFGHNHPPLREAVKEQLDKSWSVGPISPLAGELAAKICEITGVERVAFFNSGTEAVMVALRLAKAVTGKTHIVFFKGAYHGTFDSLLSLKSHPDTQLAQEHVPGITQSILNESYLLDYGTPESLDFIRDHAHEIAGVLTEPIQSRNPSMQPAEYLRQLRDITEEQGVALIFDEVISGFRFDPGGCQKLFGIKADLVTYGKVLGGGLPIGVVAGKKRFLDPTDGGFWSFGDDSFPEAKMTFVAGTFCHHPLAMATALKSLELLQADQSAVIHNLNHTTRVFCDRISNYLSRHQLPIRIVYAGSLFRFVTPGRSVMLYHKLLEKGVYIWEGRNCFLSPAHTPEILEQLEHHIITSCTELIQEGILKPKM